MGSADASASINVPVHGGWAGHWKAGANAVHIVPDFEFGRAIFRSAVALAGFIIQIEWLAVLVGASTVEAFALTLVCAPVEAFWAASCGTFTQASAVLIVPVLTVWALTGLAVAGAGMSVEILVFEAINLSADAAAGVETPDCAVGTIRRSTGALVDVGSQVRSFAVALSHGDAFAVIDGPGLLRAARVWVWDAFALAVFVVPEHLGSADWRTELVAKALAAAKLEVPHVVSWAILGQADALSVDSVEDVATAALLLFVAATAIIRTRSTNFVLISTTGWKCWAFGEATSSINDPVLGFDLSKVVVDVSCRH